jgi:mono/diheme cytochrome c family protein
MKKIWLVLAVILFVGEFFIAACNSQAPSAATMKRGELIYTQTCLPCHQADGSGVSGLNPPLKNSAYVTGEPTKLIGIVINGLSTGVEINGDAYTNPMPPFGSSLNDNEIADVLTYIRNSFANKAEKISADQVKAERK